MNRPSRTALREDGGGGADRRPRRSDWMPSTISTIAPASLTAVYACADVATTAAIPSAAKAPQANTPSELPTVVSSARRRPPRTALRTTSAVAGPGASVSSRATGTKAAS